MQHGRSMVEMLGVLAIIGVLSIGGLTAYRMAMNRYKENQLLDFISQFQMAILDLSAENIPFSSGSSYQEYQANQAILCKYNSVFCSSSSNRIDFLPSGGWNFRKSGVRTIILYLSGITTSQCAAIVQQNWHALYSIKVDYLYGKNKAELTANDRLTDAQKEALKLQCNLPVKVKQYVQLIYSVY